MVRYRDAALVLMLTFASYGRAENPPEQDGVDAFELSLEELTNVRIASVFAASRREQKTTEAPSSVTIITGEEIRRYGYRDLSDIVRHVRGFYASYDRNYARLGTRGFNRPGDYGSRFLLLVDGRRMNDMIFESASAGTDFALDLNVVDRVELIRGPASSLYGTSAFFAVINVVTRTGEDARGLRIATATGSQRTTDNWMSWGETFGKVEAFVSGSRYRSHGNENLSYSEYVQTDGGIAANQDGDRRDAYFARIKSEHFTIHSALASRTKQIPTGAWGTRFNDSRNRTRDWNGFVEGVLNQNVGRWQLESRTAYQRYGYDGDYAYDAANEEGSLLNRDGARSHSLTEELRASATFAKHLVNVGGEIRKNLRQNQFNFDVEPTAVYLDDRRQTFVNAIYFQDEFRLHPKWLVNAGIRYDHYSTFGGSTNPRLGLIYNSDPTTAIKLLYGQAFRAPNVYELYWRQGGVTKPNPSLTPERIRTLETVLEKNLGRKWRISAGGYVYRLTNLINQTIDPADGLLFNRNLDSVAGKGLEGEAAWTFTNGPEGRVSYALQFTRNRSTNALLSNSPRHVLQANVGNAWFGKRLWTGADFTVLSSRETLQGNQTGTYILPNLTIGLNRPAGGLGISATLYNFTNTRYSDPGNEEHLQDQIAQDGRTFRIRLTYHVGGNN